MARRGIGLGRVGVGMRGYLGTGIVFYWGLVFDG